MKKDTILDFTAIILGLFLNSVFVIALFLGVAALGLSIVSLFLGALNVLFKILTS